MDGFGVAWNFDRTSSIFFFFLFYCENNTYDVARMIHWYEILRIK